MRLLFRRGSAFASNKAREYLKNITPEEIKTVTVIRHAAIGDFMNIRPFLINLKEFLPNAKITLSVNRNAMYGIPEDLIDDIHIMDKDDPNNKTKKTSFFFRLKQAKTLPPQDIIFDLTDSSLTLLLVMMSKANLKIGYPYRWIRRQFYDIATLRSDFVIEAESIQHMLNILGSRQLSPLKYGLEKTYPKNNMRKDILYFAGASMRNKCWEPEKFASLIKKLSKDYPEHNHIILQGIKDDEKFLDIYEPLKHLNNIKLQEPMELNDAMNFLANTQCLVSNDTGVRNMALAVETPTVGIFFVTAPFRYWPRDGKHDCVFNVDYSSPSVESVYQTTKKLMTNLYDK